MQQDVRALEFQEGIPESLPYRERFGEMDGEIKNGITKFKQYHLRATIHYELEQNGRRLDECPFDIRQLFLQFNKELRIVELMHQKSINDTEKFLKGLVLDPRRLNEVVSQIKESNLDAEVKSKLLALTEQQDISNLEQQLQNLGPRPNSLIEFFNNKGREWDNKKKQLTNQQLPAKQLDDEVHMQLHQDKQKNG